METVATLTVGLSKKRQFFIRWQQASDLFVLNLHQANHNFKKRKITFYIKEKLGNFKYLNI